MTGRRMCDCASVILRDSAARFQIGMTTVDLDAQLYDRGTAAAFVLGGFGY